MTLSWLGIALELALAAASPIVSGRAPTPSEAIAGEPYAADKASIMTLRAANNSAIAARDLDATMAIVADDYVMTGGAGGIERSVAENRKGWAEDFATPGHDRYVRTPTDIEVGGRKGVLRAAENGTWEGIDHKPAGESRPSGRYFVHWSKASGQWRVVSETYVALGCRGPGC
jgi:ketosteroid isomerase-like protein